jgi:hypothetical protein
MLNHNRSNKLPRGYLRNLLLLPYWFAPQSLLISVMDEESSWTNSSIASNQYNLLRQPVTHERTTRALIQLVLGFSDVNEDWGHGSPRSPQPLDSTSNTVTILLFCLPLENSMFSEGCTVVQFLWCRRPRYDPHIPRLVLKACCHGGMLPGHFTGRLRIFAEFF